MNTRNIKTFATDARTLLRSGVEKRLKYWNIDARGKATDGPAKVTGGYIYQGQIYNDGTVPAKWQKLTGRMHNAQDRDDIVEEAAYTWFNRLMVLRILEKNRYINPILQWAEGTREPQLLQDAKLGNHHLRGKDRDLLILHLQENKEEQAFVLLLMDVFNSHPILQNLLGPVKSEMELLLPDDLLHSQGFLSLLMESDAISEADYKEVELIGWLYQFYISDKKDDVFAGFKKNKKARAQDIPAATQIFTPKWIVKYMVENTVGKIYLDYEPTSSLRAEMKYLVETDADKVNLQSRDVTLSGVEGASRASHKPIISDITELTLIDPACGSGHILVTGFELLFKIYREAGYTARQAVDNILQYNLFGLDIDDRAMQLARFAVLLKAAQFDADLFNRGIIPHIYSFPETNHFTSEDLQKFLGLEGHLYMPEFAQALRFLNQGKNFGSSLKLELSLGSRKFIRDRWLEWSGHVDSASLDIEHLGIFNRLHPFINILLTLTRNYVTVITNPPYLAQKNMNNDLKYSLNKLYPKSKSDLYTVFIEICINLSKHGGLISMINQHAWMFLVSFESLRKDLLKRYWIKNLLHLGPRTFNELSGEVVQSAAFIIQNLDITSLDFIPTGAYHRLTLEKSCEEKERSFLGKMNSFNNIRQDVFKKIPSWPIAYWISDEMRSLFSFGVLSDYFPVKKGIDTGKNAVFLRYWHEISHSRFANLDNDKKWHIYIKGGSFRKWYGNMDIVVNWENDGAEIKSHKGSTIRNKGYIKREAITWTLIAGDGLFGARIVPRNCVFDNNGSSVFPDNNFNYILGVLNCKVSQKILEVLNPTLAYQVGDISRIPTIWNENFSNSILVEKNIEIARNDWHSRECAFDFLNMCLINDCPSLMESAVTWQNTVTRDFFTIHANEEELNRSFIEIYGMQDELAPEVAFKEITILEQELDSAKLEDDERQLRATGLLVKWDHRIGSRVGGLPLVPNGYSLPLKNGEILSQFVSYAIGVFLGRYRLDRSGLNIAHPDATEEEKASYPYNGHLIEIDADGILPIMGEDCAFPDDTLVRTKDLVYAIWGEETLTENINFLHEGLGMDLHKFLTEKFWGYHTSMYKKKPIYWLFSSNVTKPQKAAFKTLVYMHRMDRFTLQKIRNQYLHPHQDYLAGKLRTLKENETNLNSQELKQMDLLEQQIIECRQYDDRLKSLANEQITFDLDDGVTENYKLFDGVVAEIK